MLDSTAANGWIIAVAGVLLIFLCIKIYRQKATNETANNKGTKSHSGSNEKSIKEESSTGVFPLNASEAARFYLPLIEQMGQVFQLSDLYQLAREKEFPHPHLTISAFRQNGFLLPKGDGLFSWNSVGPTGQCC